MLGRRAVAFSSGSRVRGSAMIDEHRARWFSTAVRFDHSGLARRCDLWESWERYAVTLAVDVGSKSAMVRWFVSLGCVQVGSLLRGVKIR